MTEGDRQARIPVSGGDEVGRLEDGFNRMAERLEAAVEVERYTAGVQARWAERTRIARELHDSVSQDLFSMSLIANGLREALPEADRLRHQAESLEQTANRTMLEMRTMLLELRPIALEDAGLVPALRELCRAHETRLGIPVMAELAPVRLPPDLEHTVLRVAQEALSNAARHAEPRAIELSLAEADGQVVVTVHDDGRGFDPARVVGGHGMGLEMMRGRVAELGGTLNLTSGPGRGTTVRVRIPRGDR
jgi:signal transduction histidine kinase